MSDAMGRTLLALLMLCFISLHAALTTAAAGEGEPFKRGSVLTYVETDTGDDGAPASLVAAAKCHDGCSWLAAWHAPAFCETHASPLERSAGTVPPGIVALVVPPPR